MAGGNFKLSAKKVRPGTYVNVINGKQPTAVTAPSGIATIALIGYDWGPRNEWIHLVMESPDAEKEKFGRSIYDDNTHMRMLNLIFANAVEIYVFIPGGNGAKATGNITLAEGNATATAKYEGTLGNKIKIVSVANPVEGFDVSIVLDGAEVELFEGITNVEDISSAYVDFSGEGELTAFASASLSNGTDGSENTNSAVSTFLDRSEKIKFNCMALPTSDASLITAMITKIKYIRNTIGWKCHGVVIDTEADHEGIYNLINSIEYDGKQLPKTEAAAWLAGAVAGADYVTTLTYKRVTGATGVVGELNNEASIEAIKKGQVFFTTDDSGNVILECDVNSKVTFAQEDPVDIYKGRPNRVYDSFANDLLLTFIPGRFDNSPDGWDVMEGLGRAILKAYSEDGALQNVDLEADFLVDRGASTGDSVYINVGLQAVDSAEKYYFTVVAR